MLSFLVNSSHFFRFMGKRDLHDLFRQISKRFIFVIPSFHQRKQSTFSSVSYFLRLSFFSFNNISSRVSSNSNSHHLFRFCRYQIRMNSNPFRFQHQSQHSHLIKSQSSSLVQQNLLTPSHSFTSFKLLDKNILLFHFLHRQS